MPSGAQALSSPKIKNLLIATDFSACAEQAISAAAAIARCFGATIHILHVLPHEPSITRKRRSSSVPSQCEEALGRLRTLSETEPLRDMLCHLIAEPGKVADVVADVVGRLGIDLIVVGTHGRRGLEHVVIGSAAQEIMRRANCAVMTIGPRSSELGITAGKVDSILYATDFSPGSRLALEYAIAFARVNSARIIAFHAIPIPNVSVDALMDIDVETRRVIDYLQELMPRYVVHEVAVCHGLAADGILSAARKRRADLIVMGAHAGGVASAHMPWATVHEVVSAAECPVLTARAH